MFVDWQLQSHHHPLIIIVVVVIAIHRNREKSLNWNRVVSGAGGRHWNAVISHSITVTLSVTHCYALGVTHSYTLSVISVTLLLRKP